MLGSSDDQFRDPDRRRRLCGKQWQDESFSSVAVTCVLHILAKHVGRQGSLQPIVNVNIDTDWGGRCTSSERTASEGSIAIISAIEGRIGSVPEGGVIELAAGTYDAPADGWTIFPDLNAGGTGVGVVDVYVFWRRAQAAVSESTSGYADNQGM